MDVGPLTAKEIERAEDYWRKTAQSGLTQIMEIGEFKTLTPSVDNKGIIRIRGRVNLSLLSYDNKHLALLPHKHWISTLVTRDTHQSGHTTTTTATAKVRRKY